MFFFFFFFEQEVIDIIKQSLQGSETLEVGEILTEYAYDYYLPKGCKKLGFPEKTAIEVKRNLAPGMLSVLISDAKNAFKTGKFNHFVVIYEDGNVYQDWIPEEIKGFVSFLSKDEFKEKAPILCYAEHWQPEWQDEREFRIRKLCNEFSIGPNTLFVGAGLSCSLGVPNWGDLLKRLHNHFSKKVENYPTYKSIKKDSRKSYLITARYLQDTANKEKLKFISEIRKRLYRKSHLDSDLMDAVIGLLEQNKIGEVITYNYDTLLEQRMTEELIRCTTINGQNRRIKNAIPVMHVHGVIHPKDLDYDNNVVLSEEEYHKLYKDSYHWANVGQMHALTNSTCIFVGLSMTDPSLRRLLDIAHQQGSGDIEHYAFLIRSEFDCHKQTEDIFSQMGVNIIWCEDKDDVPRQIKKIQSYANKGM